MGARLRYQQHARGGSAGADVDNGIARQSSAPVVLRRLNKGVKLAACLWAVLLLLQLMQMLHAGLKFRICELDISGCNAHSFLRPLNRIF